MSVLSLQIQTIGAFHGLAGGTSSVDDVCSDLYRRDVQTQSSSQVI